MKEKSLHPYIPELCDLLEKGKVSRREFMRYSTLLGLSYGVASQLAGFSRPTSAIAQQIKRGGTLKVSCKVNKLIHPNRAFTQMESNLIMQVCEKLTFIDPNNISHPYLLENWEASDDLKTWTLNIRKGIRFNNGDELTSDDVIFTINQWMNKDIGSALLNLFKGFMSQSGIEKANNYQVKLHLNRSEIAIPEYLAHMQGFILNHRTFEGEFLKTPHGTGPYTIEDYRPGELATMRRRTDYWQKGADGTPLPYMDGIEFIQMEEELPPQIAALKQGEVDFLNFDRSLVEAYLALRDNPDIKIQPVTTNACRTLGMRADMKPWTDNRVRTAVKLCQNREKILQLCVFGEGMLGSDTHVSPMHPEYCSVPVPKYNPEKAKALLSEAGYPNGIDVNLSVCGEWKEWQRYAEALEQDAAPAGIRIKLNITTKSEYYAKWNVYDFSIINWTHRPLGTQVLNMGYALDEEGKPVKWNWTRWADKEFNTLLAQANGTLDVEERRKVFCKLEKIQMERGTVGISYWANNWLITTNRVMDAEAYPRLTMAFNNVWLNR